MKRIYHILATALALLPALIGSAIAAGNTTIDSFHQAESKRFEKLRGSMVEDQLKSRNIQSEVVLDAMRAVPRHLFVPKNLRSSAYNDAPLPIGLGQTISQPYIVAFMTEQLDPDPGMKILEIGTGSGYQAAILAYLGCDVYTIELLEELAVRAEKILSELNFNNVKIKCGNGYLG